MLCKTGRITSNSSREIKDRAELLGRRPFPVLPKLPTALPLITKRVQHPKNTPISGIVVGNVELLKVADLPAAGGELLLDRRERQGLVEH